MTKAGVYSPEEIKRSEDQLTRREALNERFARLVEPQFLEEESRALSVTLANVLAERTFKLDRNCLTDEGPNDRWDWTGWRDELAENKYEGVLGFFRQRTTAVAEESGDSIQGQRWAEAQAIRINLTCLIAVLTGSASVDLDELAYLGPMRAVPPRHLLASTDDFSGSSGSGLDAWQRLCDDSGAVESVNRWFGSSWLRLPFRLRMRRLVYADEPPSGAGLPDLVFEDIGTQSHLSHRDLGFGVTQVLPVLVNAATQRHSMIAIEQPELHLHPAQQAELGEVIELPVTPDGDFGRPWPGGFFAERFQELP